MDYKLCDDVSIERIDGNIVLLRDNGDAATLNETAALMFDLLLNTGVERAIQELVNRFDVNEQEIISDFEELINKLVDKDLVCHG